MTFLTFVNPKSILKCPSLEKYLGLTTEYLFLMFNSFLTVRNTLSLKFLSKNDLQNCSINTLFLTGALASI